MQLLFASITSGPDLLILLALIVLLFGSSQIPKLARSLGQAKREFERGNTDAGRPNDNEKPNP